MIGWETLYTVGELLIFCQKKVFHEQMYLPVVKWRRKQLMDDSAEVHAALSLPADGLLGPLLDGLLRRLHRHPRHRHRQLKKYRVRH